MCRSPCRLACLLKHALLIWRASFRQRGGGGRPCMRAGSANPALSRGTPKHYYTGRRRQHPGRQAGEQKNMIHVWMTRSHIPSPTSHLPCLPLFSLSPVYLACSLSSLRAAGCVGALSTVRTLFDSRNPTSPPHARTSGRFFRCAHVQIHISYDKLSWHW